MAEKARILVAEDDDLQRETLVALLSDEGYDVREASSGNDAIPLIYGVEFNLVILDLKMPYIDGFEVLKFIKGTFQKTKVIVLTAYGDLINIEKCRKLGADEVIGKPFNLGDLFTTIREVMKK
jgi:CheY-like chemotaxis protein